MVLAIVTPIRIPVKDPGPVTTMILSKSFGVILAFLKTPMILGNASLDKSLPNFS